MVNNSRSIYLIAADDPQTAPLAETARALAGHLHALVITARSATITLPQSTAPLLIVISGVFSSILPSLRPLSVTAALVFTPHGTDGDVAGQLKDEVTDNVVPLAPGTGAGMAAELFLRELGLDAPAAAAAAAAAGPAGPAGGARGAGQGSSTYYDAVPDIIKFITGQFPAAVVRSVPVVALSGRQLSVFPVRELGIFLGMKELDLSHNNIVQVPHQVIMTHMPSLERLDLSHNLIPTHEPFYHLRAHPSLRALAVNNNPFVSANNKVQLLRTLIVDELVAHGVITRATAAPGTTRAALAPEPGAEVAVSASETTLHEDLLSNSRVRSSLAAFFRARTVTTGALADLERVRGSRTVFSSDNPTQLANRGINPGSDSQSAVRAALCARGRPALYVDATPCTVPRPVGGYRWLEFLNGAPITMQELDDATVQSLARPRPASAFPGPVGGSCPPPAPARVREAAAQEVLQALGEHSAARETLPPAVGAGEWGPLGLPPAQLSMHDAEIAAAAGRVRTTADIVHENLSSLAPLGALPPITRPAGSGVPLTAIAAGCKRTPTVRLTAEGAQRQGTETLSDWTSRVIRSPQLSQTTVSSTCSSVIVDDSEMAPHLPEYSHLSAGQLARVAGGQYPVRGARLVATQATDALPEGRLHVAAVETDALLSNAARTLSSCVVERTDTVSFEGVRAELARGQAPGRLAATAATSGATFVNSPCVGQVSDLQVSDLLRGELRAQRDADSTLLRSIRQSEQASLARTSKISGTSIQIATNHGSTRRSYIPQCVASDLAASMAGGAPAGMRGHAGRGALGDYVAAEHNLDRISADIVRAEFCPTETGVRSRNISTPSPAVTSQQAQKEHEHALQLIKESRTPFYAQQQQSGTFQSWCRAEAACASLLQRRHEAKSLHDSFAGPQTTQETDSSSQLSAYLKSVARSPLASLHAPVRETVPRRSMLSVESAEAAVARARRSSAAPALVAAAAAAAATTYEEDLERLRNVGVGICIQPQTVREQPKLVRAPVSFDQVQLQSDDADEIARTCFVSHITN